MKVVYIAGKGRSGSTLLGNLLGELDGWCPVGEMVHLWDHGLTSALPCGCGHPIPECPQWTEVLDPAADPVLALAPDVVAGWQQAVLRWSRLPRLLRARPGRATGWPELDGYTQLLRVVYQRLGEVTGDTVVVDSSKLPFAPVPLGLVPGIDVTVVQLVRDPRAVAHSWRKRKAWTTQDPTDEMPRNSAAFSTLSWTARNAVGEVLARLAPPDRVLVRYEDLIADPRATLKKIVTAVEGRPAGHADLPMVDDHTVRLHAQHTVWGNADRFRTGDVHLREDLGWQGHLSRADRVTVAALAGPLLRRYGYPVLGSASDGGSGTTVSSSGGHVPPRS